MWSVTKASILTLAVGLLALSGCGSSSSSTSSSASTPTAATTPATSSAPTSSTPAAASVQKLSLEANPEGQLKFNTTSLSAKSGPIAIDFTNMSPVGHDVAVASSSGAVVGTTPIFQGGSHSLALNLKPGTYKFYCTVPGHRQAGMEGTLKVN